MLQVRPGCSSWRREKDHEVMKLKSYLLLLLVLYFFTVLAILYLPGLSENIETWMLRFLARNAALPA